MSVIIKYVISALIGYLIGSTTLAIFIGDVFYNRDVRNEGSGNMGATNMTRSFGIKAGVWTLLWDILKCVVAMAIGKKIAGDSGAAIAGGAAIIGHAFPCLHGFKGGKCVACGAAVAFIISFKIGIIVLTVFLMTVLICKKVSLGSILAAATLAVTSVILAPEIAYKILGVFTGLSVIILHHENIKRLFKGEEPKFHIDKK